MHTFNEADDWAAIAYLYERSALQPGARNPFLVSGSAHSSWSHTLSRMGMDVQVLFGPVEYTAEDPYPDELSFRAAWLDYVRGVAPLRIFDGEHNGAFGGDVEANRLQRIAHDAYGHGFPGVPLYDPLAEIPAALYQMRATWRRGGRSSQTGALTVFEIVGQVACSQLRGAFPLDADGRQRVLSPDAMGVWADMAVALGGMAVEGEVQQRLALRRLAQIARHATSVDSCTHPRLALSSSDYRGRKRGHVVYCLCARCGHLISFHS